MSAFRCYCNFISDTEALDVNSSKCRPSGYENFRADSLFDVADDKLAVGRSTYMSRVSIAAVTTESIETETIKVDAVYLLYLSSVLLRRRTSQVQIEGK